MFNHNDLVLGLVYGYIYTGDLFSASVNLGVAKLAILIAMTIDNVVGSLTDLHFMRMVKKRKILK